MIKRFLKWLATPAVSDFDRGYLWAEAELAKGRKTYDLKVLIDGAVGNTAFDRGARQAIHNHTSKKTQ